MLFFSNSHSIGPCTAYKPAVYVVYMKNQMLTAPPFIILSVLYIHGNKKSFSLLVF